MNSKLPLLLYCINSYNALMHLSMFSPGGGGADVGYLIKLVPPERGI